MERISKLSPEVKARLLWVHGIKVNVAPDKADMLAEETDKLFKQTIEILGIKFAVGDMSKEELKKTLAEDRKLGTKASMIRFTVASVEEVGGIKKYIESLPMDVLKSIAEYLLDADEPLPAKLSAAREKLIEEITNEGIICLLSGSDLPLLRLCCKELDIDYSDIASKNELANGLLTGKVKVEKVEKKKQIAPCKEKPEIKKGVTKQDLFQHFYLEQLIEWANKNKVRHSGNKKQLIKDIIAFLDGDQSVMIDESRKRPGKKPTEGEKPAKRAKKEKKEEKQEEKKEEKEEEKEEKKEEKEEDEKKEDKKKEKAKKETPKKEKKEKKEKSPKKKKEDSPKKKKQEKETPKKRKSESKEDKEEPPKKRAKKC